MYDFTDSSECVSFDHESLILVDSADRVLGYESKADVHRGSGKLHRAFSIFLFNGPERVLLHQRSGDKPLWPGYWTNSCCSHPRRGESYDEATSRRLREELGVATTLSPLYRFEYFARFSGRGAERELCTVYIGNLERDVGIDPNPLEIHAWGWFDCDEVDDLAACDPHRFTPWFLLEWARIRGDQRLEVEGICEELRSPMPSDRPVTRRPTAGAERTAPPR